jgi:hypothetical protein
MRIAFLRVAFIVFPLSAVTVWGEGHLVVPDSSVGKNLQAAVSVALSEPASQEVEMTIRSSDPAKLLISRNPMEAGTESLVIRVREKFRASPEFWLQAVTNEGSATYTVTTTQGYGVGTGTVTLMPSAIVVVGPLKAPTLRTTVGGYPSKLTLYSVRLDSSLNYVEEQLLAVRPSVAVDLVSSNKLAGAVTGTPIVIGAGTSSATTDFRPAGEGETVVSVIEPPGFSAPAQMATWKAVVQTPGLAVSDNLAVGKDLEVVGVLSLGAVAPAGGLTVTLVSDNPKQLLLSESASQAGSASLTLTVKPGTASASYFLQALVDSGTASYSASAPGYRGRSGMISFTPSGVLLTPASQGPPDEAQVLRNEDSTYKFVASLAGQKTQLAVWMVQLDPVTHRGADITVQPLRAGLSVTIFLTNKEPGVGRIPSSVSIFGGLEHSIADFEPLGAGSTVISVSTPKGFTTSANSTSVIGLVSQ